jgi:signal transduction histidine kinase
MASPVAATAPLPALRLALVALAGAGFAAGLAFLVLVLESDHTDDRGVAASVGLLVGWSFLGTGLFAWWRRPGNRTGALMVAVGFAWCATGVSASNEDLVFTAGIALDALLFAFAGHLLLAFPSGRLQTKAELGVVTAGYLVVTVLQLPALLFEDHGGDEPRNLLLIEPDRRLSDALDAAQAAAAVALIVASLTILVRRWRTATPRQRRALAPVVWTGAAAFVAFVVVIGFDTAGNPQGGLELLAYVLLAMLPFGFLGGLLRSRLAQATAVSELVARLGQAPEPEALRAALADALGDPSLTLAYWLPGARRFVDANGRPISLQAGAWTEVELHGRRIAAIAHDRSLADEPQLVRAAGAAAALALENQRLSAELRASIEELRASRARLVEAGDAERRRLERDLHDGAQSRLVALAVKLRLARMKASDKPEVEAILDESSVELQASLDELRELARGIHPAVLTDRGLGAALESLASRAPLPVQIAGAPPDELPPTVTTAIYFVVSEALTNVAKYARANSATVAVRRAADTVVVEVSDDGVGGADIASGSGLRGLSDRVAALDGRLELDSQPGEGTQVRAEIPVPPPSQATAHTQPGKLPLEPVIGSAMTACRRSVRAAPERPHSRRPSTPPATTPRPATGPATGSKPSAWPRPGARSGRGAAGVRLRAIGAGAAPASVKRQLRRAECSDPCVRTLARHAARQQRTSPFPAQASIDKFRRRRSLPTTFEHLQRRAPGGRFARRCTRHRSACGLARTCAYEAAAGRDPVGPWRRRRRAISAALSAKRATAAAVMPAIRPVDVPPVGSVAGTGATV